MSPEPIEDTLETFDFGLQQGRWAEQRFETESIGDDLLFPVCSPEMFDSFKSPGNPRELADKPLLSLQQRGRDWPDWREFLGEFGVTMPLTSTITVLNTYPMYLDLAELGEGVDDGEQARPVERHGSAAHLTVPPIVFRARPPPLSSGHHGRGRA